MKTLVLASKSPRRKELLTLLEIPFVIQVKEVEEIIDKDKTARENVEALAKIKAEAIGQETCSIIIGCDTIVSLDHKILGKPQNAEDAKRMLRMLSDKTHEVCTGVAIWAGSRWYVFSEVTTVKMKRLTEKEIEWYVETKEPLDKAGAYGIQGKGARFIEGIVGDYFNVVGLPVHRLYEVLRAIEPNLFEKRS